MNVNGTDYIQLVEDVEDGNESALRAYGILKQLKKDVEQCLDQIMPHVSQEAETYNDKSFEAQGFKFEKRAGGRQYDFKHIEEWTKAKEELDKLQAKYKSAASAYEKGQTMVDDDTGEVVPAALVTYRKDSITAIPLSY